MTPTALAQTAARASSDVATSSSAFEEWLVGDLSGRDGSRVLVVSPSQLDPRRFATTAAVTMLCCSARASDDADPGLAAAPFDNVYLHRMIAIAAPGQWLDRARRLLSVGGRVVIAIDPAEFGFAPLPAGGDARLLGRILADAGFCRVEIVHRTARLIIAAAYRDERDRAR